MKRCFTQVQERWTRIIHDSLFEQALSDVKYNIISLGAAVDLIRSKLDLSLFWEKFIIVSLQIGTPIQPSALASATMSHPFVADLNGFYHPKFVISPESTKGDALKMYSVFYSERKKVGRSFIFPQRNSVEIKEMLDPVIEKKYFILLPGPNATKKAFLDAHAKCSSYYKQKGQKRIARKSQRAILEIEIKKLRDKKFKYADIATIINKRNIYYKKLTGNDISSLLIAGKNKIMNI